jgi:hypothetical protein
MHCIATAFSGGRDGMDVGREKGRERGEGWKDGMWIRWGVDGRSTHCPSAFVLCASALVILFDVALSMVLGPRIDAA